MASSVEAAGEPVPMSAVLMSASKHIACLFVGAFKSNSDSLLTAIQPPKLCWKGF
ncbi:hypothetical protein HanIR_Chr11g0527821 [Helianthus annuus]|nr:hypothetical protein HanIR_Chr11g0527821 [Helianthus annuus]